MTKFSITAQLKLQAPNNVSSIVNSIRSQLQGITATVNVVVPPQSQRNLQNAQRQMQRTSKAAKEAQGAVEAFGGASALAAKRFLAFSVAGGAIIKFTQALTQGVRDAIAFEREMNRIAQATGSSAKSVGEISKEISRLSTTLGVSSIELSKASLVLAQAGLSAQDTKKSLEALAKSDLAPTFESINDTAEASIAMFQQFGVSADNLEKKLGSINTVAAKFAVESSDITTAVRRTGGAFAAAGGNLEELLALFTSVRQTTRESAESIATGFRTIFTRLQRVRTQNFLQTMGVDLIDEGQFVGPYEAIRRLSTAMKELKGTDPRFAQIVEELGGFRQISKVIPLIQQFGVAQKALNVAMAGTGSLSEDAARSQQTLAVQIQKTKEQFAEMIRKLTGSTEFRGMVKFALQLAEAFTKIVSSLQPLLPLIATFAGVSLGNAISPFIRGARAKTVLHAAGGGLVPGTGNRDTVPAMLMPGEFVLRKKAVSALGLNKGGRVPKVQKFAGGSEGKVKPKYEPISQDNFDGIEGLQAKGVGGIFLNAKGRAGETGGVFERGVITVNTKEGPAKLPFTAAGFSKTFMKQFEDEIANSIIPLTNSLGSKIATQLGSTPTGGMKNRADIPNYASIVGGLFEGSIKTLGPPFTLDQATFDFPQGLKGHTNKWAGGSALSDIPVDAKRTWTTKAKASIAAKAQAMIDDPTSLQVPERKEWKQGESLTLAHARSMGISQGAFMGNKDDLLDELHDRGYTDARIKPKAHKNERTELVFAQGGKVPALLTPGEIVVDKQTAGKLGTPALKKLNHAEKFATGGMVGKPPWIFKPQGASIAPGNVGPTKQRQSSRLQWLRANQGTLDPHELQELLSLQARMGFVQQSRTSRFSKRLGFAGGGRVERTVGYLDGDVLANPEHANIVNEQIKKLGIKGGVTGYHRYLVSLASQKRQAGSLKRFKGLYGVPGSGKTHLVKAPKPGDDATLRSTKRVPILTPEDIDKVSEVVDTIAYGPKLMDEVKAGGAYSNVDRMFMLSSSTKEEQKLVDANRKLRQVQTAAGTSTTSEGRSAEQAAVRGAPIDSGAAEAVAYKALGKKRTAILGMQPGYKLRKKSESEIPELEEEMIGLLYGALSPSTMGHASNAKLAADSGIAAKNLFVAISKQGGTAKEGDEHANRTLIYDQNMRAALAQKSFPNATVIKAGSSDFMGTAPTVFERPTQGGRRKFVKAAPGSIALTGDDKDEKETAKYTNAGYKLVQGARDDISGTAARQAIRSDDEATMQRMFHPNALPLIKKNQGAIKARENVLPEIFKRVQAKIGNQVAEIEKELEAYPKVITGKIRTEQPDVAAAVQKLRDKRDGFKKMKDRLPPRYLALLGKLFKDKYGYALEMSQGGAVPAMLTPGEAVVNKSTASKIGTTKLQAFNQGGLVQKFAGGGSIGGFDRIAQASFAFSGITALISSFDGVSKGAKDLLGILTSIGSQFMILQGISSTLASKFKNLDITANYFNRKQSALFEKRKEFKSTYKTAQEDYTQKRIRSDRINRRAARLNQPLSPQAQAIVDRANTDTSNSQLALTVARRDRKVNARAITKNAKFAGISSAVGKFGGIGSLLGSAALTAGGSYLTEQGSADMEAGRGGEGKYKTGKAMGSVGSAAAMGATLGMAFGPIGIAAGVVVGGLYGLYSGLKNANKELANMKAMKEFNKSIEKTSRVLTALGEGKATFGEAKTQVDAQVAQTIAQLRNPNLSDDSRTDIKAGIKNNILGFNTYLNEAAKKASSFGNFIDLAGDDVLRFVGSFSDIPTSQLKAEFKKTVEANIKAKESTLKLTKVNDDYLERMRNLVNLGQAFETLALHMQSFDTSINNISSLLSENVSVGRVDDESALLASPEKFFDGTRFAELVARDITNNPLLKTAFPDAIGGSLTPLNEKLTKDVTDASNAIGVLPNALLGLRDNLANFEGEQAVDKILESFEGAPGMVSSAIRKVALNIIGGEGKEALLIEKIRSDFTGTLREFNDELKVVLEQAAIISKAMTEETNRRLEFLDTYSNLMEKELALRLKKLDTLSQSEDLRAKAYDRPVNLNTMQALDDQRQRETLGVNADAMNNPMLVQDRLLNAHNNLLKYQVALRNADIEKQKDLIAGMNQEQTVINNLNKALEFMGDITNRTAVTMQKVEKEQGRVNFKVNRADKALFAESAAEVRDIALTNLAANVASTTGRIDFIPPKLRGDLQQLLQETKGLGELEVFNGQTSEQVTSNLRYNYAKDRGWSEADAQKYANATSDELEKQRKILEEQLFTARLAADMQHSIFDISLSTLAERFNDSLKMFSAKMAQTLNEQKIKSLEDTKAKDTLALEKSRKAGGGLERMSALAGGTDEDTTIKLGNNLATIQAYQKEVETAKGLEQFRTAYNPFEIGGDPKEQNVQKFGPGDATGTDVKQRLLDYMPLATSGAPGPNREQRTTITARQRDDIQRIEETKMKDSGASDDVIEKFRDSFYKQLNDPKLKQDSFVQVMGAMTRAIDETVKDANDRGNVDVAGKQLEALGLLDFANNIIQSTEKMKMFKEAFELYQLDPRPYIELQRNVASLAEVIKLHTDNLAKLEAEKTRLAGEVTGIENRATAPEREAAQAQKAFLDRQRALIDAEIARRNAEAARTPGMMATGGFVRGTGSGDKVRALLEPGEFVLNRNAVSAIGLGPLSSVNDGIARFAKGGPVRILNPEAMDYVQSKNDTAQMESDLAYKPGTMSNSFGEPNTQTTLTQTSAGLPAYNGPGYEWKGVKYKTLDAMLDAQKTPEAKQKLAVEQEATRTKWLADNERIAQEAKTREIVNQKAKEKLTDISNRGVIDTLKYDAADTELSGGRRILAGALLGPAYVGKGVGHIGAAAVGGVKTAAYGTVALGSAAVGAATGSEAVNDFTKRTSALFDATASDVRGNISFGLAGTQGAERQQLTGGVGFSQDFTQGQKTYTGVMGTALDTAIGIGMTPGLPGTTQGGVLTNTAKSIISGGKNLVTSGAAKVVSGMAGKVESGFGGLSEVISAGASKVKNFMGEAKAGYQARAANKVKSKAAYAEYMAKHNPQPIKTPIGAGERVGQMLGKNAAGRGGVAPDLVTKPSGKFGSMYKNTKNVLKKFTSDPDAPSVPQPTNTAVQTTAKVRKGRIEISDDVPKATASVDEAGLAAKRARFHDGVKARKAKNAAAEQAAKDAEHVQIKANAQAEANRVVNANRGKSGLNPPDAPRPFQQGEVLSPRDAVRQKYERFKADQKAGKYSTSEENKIYSEINDEYRRIEAAEKVSRSQKRKVLKEQLASEEDNLAKFSQESKGQKSSTESPRDRARKARIENDKNKLNNDQVSGIVDPEYVVTKRRKKLSSKRQENEGHYTGKMRYHHGIGADYVTAARKQGIEGFNTGSLVPGSGSGDTVPALLEPGEFVLNRNAVSAIGAGTLTHINKKVGRFQKGGTVKMQEGGITPLGGSYKLDASQMETAVKNFGSYVDKLADFANSMNGLSIQLQATHTVEVIINGAQVLQGLNDSMQNLIVTETNKAINSMLDKKFQLPPMEIA